VVSADPNARITSRENLHDSLAILRVRPDSGSVPAFEPGQFTNLGLPGVEPGTPLLRRAFTIASSPDDRGEFEFFIQRVDEGELTRRLWELGTGGRVWLDERVYGRFTLAEIPTHADLVLVATGTGLAPYISMLRHYQGRSRWKRCALLHGARSVDDLGYRAELEALAARDASFHYLPTLTRETEGSDWSGLRGRVQTWLDPERFRALTGFALTPESARVFLCGNPEMIADVTARLAEHGFKPHHRRTPGEIHSERYW
jgi:ferredoxin--NADP+ reductase